ncbi:MAG: AlpA family phage regulatory protein [Gemmatimonadetes bacterium]|nr:AlpA family phage regulatory protein [Gemmatimonadota bacterium]MYJ69256.1 AlpA family phage regulatory protein [Gemmatimonadota bacterium]
MLKVLRYPEVQAVTGLSRKSIERRINAGTFPRPVRLGARAVGFRSDEIEAWIKARPRAD